MSPMPTARSDANCGVVWGSGGKAKEIVAAGGWSTTGQVTNVEILQLDNMTWRTGDSVTGLGEFTFLSLTSKLMQAQHYRSA